MSSLNLAKSNPISSFWLDQRLNVAASFISYPIKTVLDVGCGEGYFLEMIKRKSPDLVAYGLDPSKDNIEFAQKLVPHAIFLLGNSEHLPFKKATFDAVSCLEVLDHLENPLSALKEFNQVLKPKGIVIISLPNYSNILWEPMWLAWTNSLGRHWHGAHCTKLNLKSLETELDKGGFKIDDIKYANAGLTIVIKCIKTMDK